MLNNHNTQFVIIGNDPGNGEQMYWNNAQGWISDFTEATTFDREILTAPLPHGATGFIEFTLEGELVSTIDRVSSGRGEIFFGKSEDPS